MLRDVFGDEPTARQEAKLQDAIQILREGPGLGKKWRLSSRDELADRLESFRPFGRLSGKSFDNPDGRALISAIREGRVDLSVALADKEGRIRQPSGGVGVRDVAGTVVQQLDRAWDDGWAKDEKEIPEALQNISQTDREILDAWYALLMEGRLESIRWSSRFADIFCDVADVAMGRSEEDS